MRLSFPHPLLVWSGRVESTDWMYGHENKNKAHYESDVQYIWTKLKYKTSMAIGKDTYPIIPE